jgi:ADP-ribosyltransferase exoenzyme
VSNPLVAQAHSSTTWNTGLGLIEDAAQISSGIQNNSWVDGTLGTVGGSLDILGMVIDPLGSLVAWGVSWLMEHVKPLKDALDWLAGNPDEIAAHAATWENVARFTGEARQQYSAAIGYETASWLGTSGDAYRDHAGIQLSVMEGIAKAAHGISSAVQGAGLLVGLVRGIVRDLIAQFVATLAARLPQWLAEEGLTLGIATPVVIGQVAALVAKWVNKIQHFVRALLNSLRRLQPLVHRLGEILTELRQLLAKLARSNPLKHGDETGAPHVRDSPDGTHVDDPLDSLAGQPLTDTDQAALHDYTTNDGYTTMNPFLRDSGGYSDADKVAIQARADRVSEGLAKLPPQPGTAYRGVQYSHDILARYEPGQVVTERAFTSTSQDPNVAQGAFNGNTLMTITGRNGKDIAPFSNYPEAEILYDKGTSFKVISKVWNPRIDKWVIHMEEV